MTERAAADDFLFTALSGSPALVTLLPGGIHPDNAPEGANAETAPYLVFAQVASRIETANARVRVYDEMQYQVRAIFAGNGPEADDADALIDSLLSNETGGELKVEHQDYLIDCMRSRDLSMTSNSSPGRTYRYAGGWYRITARRLI